MTVAAAADLTLYRLGPDDFGVISAIRRVWDAAGQVSEKTMTSRRTALSSMMLPSTPRSHSNSKF
jgi:YD repeat-containing protein